MRGIGLHDDLSITDQFLGALPVFAFFHLYLQVHRIVPGIFAFRPNPGGATSRVIRLQVSLRL